MDYTITWKILELYRKADTGYVFKVKFKVSAFCSVSQKTVAKQHQVLLDTPETLIPFENLSEDTIVQWVKDASNEFLVEEDLCAKLSQIAEPTIKQGLPWESDDIYADTLSKGTI
jgi:hypothetical protein